METQLVKCLLNGTWVVHGIFSRNMYTFTPEQSTLPVDIRDLPDILAKTNVDGGCCGRPRTETQIFELVE